MLKLAQYDCKQTITMMDNYFAEGDFQERLIMNQFSKYPKQQMDFLSNYITKNEKEIEQTMTDRSRNPTIANKFERYLVQFVKLLCQQQPDEVEKWVSKSYFPVEKCLKVCTDAQNQLGVAILTKSNGAPHEAIAIYCKILTQFPCLGLLE